MANAAGKTAEGEFERFRRRFRIAVFAGAAALLVVPLLALAAMAATDDGENIVLTRNQVVKSPSGARMWRGTMKNHTDSEYRDVAVTIHFLDRFGRPVGEVSGEAARMVPGTSFDLQAPLPATAADLQVQRLHWRTGDARRFLGPYRPWAFGYVQY